MEKDPQTSLWRIDHWAALIYLVEFHPGRKSETLGPAPGSVGTNKGLHDPKLDHTWELHPVPLCDFVPWGLGDSSTCVICGNRIWQQKKENICSHRTHTHTNTHTPTHREKIKLLDVLRTHLSLGNPGPPSIGAWCPWQGQARMGALPDQCHCEQEQRMRNVLVSTGQFPQ